ncbi:MAG TPA: tRNA pseudouridine(13) synthase TruD [Candidatus Saccharicenans sp.]|jgi:tRNA pseudouridine13 synthase|nr:tRNA pseudouridine(13) synthase TruD [Candidatus Saccharicenans sp.]HOT68320.1 tRNA pseudouridine(13) synthase TruD [Candidatus Saccharicenans sp.]HPC87698.1 tRNA pseudouridine(13) synthase TruD [Candidatus Saccharicenans sp.]HQH60452.1 tRNA pseudouridine(13) synthase TruD [Candidatus Saccharicenans sp.]HRT25477.1 tRNA pseudouridine(13) synthase TruD [Candidatus Saccharicenans sp.]
MIKARPEDFIVEEIASLPLVDRGEFRVYQLTKKNWTTPDLVHFLAKYLSISPKAIAYGGKKDKHGLTTQYITIRSQKDFSLEEPNFSLKSVGFMRRPMSPALIEGNRFRITIRQLKAIEPLLENLQEVETYGFPNFFDDQRFRGTNQELGFFADRVLRGHYNGALQIFLQSQNIKAADRKNKERIAQIIASWRNWEKCLELAQGLTEKRIFRTLLLRPDDYLAALEKIPREEISMAYAAFGSYLWNELLRRLLRAKIEDLVEVEAESGTFLFWHRLDEPTLAYLQQLKLPTPAARMHFPDDFSRQLYCQLLADHNLKFSSFRTRALSRVFFRSFERRVLLYPRDLQVVSQGEDELHPGSKSLILSFSLPRGSFATMLIKRITLEG